jgi:chromosome segregation ATPase
MPRNQVPLNEVLRTSNVRNAVIQRIDDALRTRDQKIADADLQISKKIYENRVLEEALSKTQEALRQRSAELETEKMKSAEWQERKQLQDGLLRIAGTEIEKRLAEVEALMAKNEDLAGKMQDVEAEKAELRNQIVRIGIAEQSEAMAMANEVSARRTLKLIQGLRQDIGEKDEEIEELKKAVAEGDTKAHGVRRALASKSEEVQHLMQRKEQLAERERESGGEAAALKAEVEKLKKRVKEGDEVAGQLQGLVERLLKLR